MIRQQQGIDMFSKQGKRATQGNHSGGGAAGNDASARPMSHLPIAASSGENIDFAVRFIDNGVTEM